MKKIGMIVAVEIAAVVNKYGSMLSDEVIAGYRVLRYKTEKYELIIVNCGVGEIAAASGTQFLISEYHVDCIVNFGVVGGLTEEMTKTKACIVEKVVHYEIDTSALDHVPVGRYTHLPDIYQPTDAVLFAKARALFPDLKPVICASGNKFVDAAEEKRQLHLDFNADICEMEAAGILMTCDRNKIPCVMIKIVSDSITGGAEEFTNTVDEAADQCMVIVNEILDTL